MGLDDVVKDRAYKVGEVKVDRPRTMKLPREWWETVATSYPSMLHYKADKFTEKQTLWFIRLLDEVIQDEVDGWKISEEQKREARKARETLVEEYL